MSIPDKDRLRFRHSIIDPNPIGTHHSACLVGDLNGDGLNEVVAGPNAFRPPVGMDRGLSQEIIPEFYARTYAGQVFSETRVQVADINDDGVSELVMG